MVAGTGFPNDYHYQPTSLINQQARTTTEQGGAIVETLNALFDTRDTL